MKKIVDDLLLCKMVYQKLTSSWDCDTILVPNCEPAKFLFTGELLPVKTFSLKHSFVMPNKDQELH